MSHPVVLIAERLSPATVEALGNDCVVREVDGTQRPELLAALADADAVLIRSATQMDAEALRAAPKLRVIARAGVGLDNVDVKAATQAGVMVVNAPTSNIISAAELTIAHILNVARHIPAAHESLAKGQWLRSQFSGVELYEKTVGIVGLGRIGTLVAARLQAFGAEVVAYDPYVTPARATQLGVRLVDFDDLLRESDFVTVHMPKTPETLGLIGAPQLELMKKTAYLVNVARGGLVDEGALHDALVSGSIAGAAVDVFTKEPPEDSPLLGLPNIVTTPHLGASTDEAQEKAGVSVAKSVKSALAGDLVPDAVNVAGGSADLVVRAAIPLVEKLGQMLVAVACEPLTALDVEVRGELAEFDVSVLKLAALKGVFTNIVAGSVSYVNAPLLAEQRGLDVRQISDFKSEQYRNLISLRGLLSDGSEVSVAGTLTGANQVEKLVGVNGYDVEVPIAEHHIVMMYDDRPGIVAIYGSRFGEAGINIAGMQISRTSQGGKALAVVTVDSPASDELIASLKQAIDADMVQQISVTHD